MKLPRLSLDNFRFVWVLVFMATALGLLSFFTMSRSEDPLLRAPNYSVAVVYPGATPNDLETWVIDPIEEALDQVDDLVEIKSSLRDGFALIQIEGDWSVDIDETYDDIVTAVNSVRDELPDEIYRLDVNKFSPLDVKILQLALVSDAAPYAELIAQAERLETRLRNVAGVREVEVKGYPEEEVRIALDMEKMAQLGVNLPQVLGVLEANHGSVPGGELTAGKRTFNVKSTGSYQDLTDLREVVVGSFGGKRVHLRDLATVELGYEDATYLARYNGENAVFVTVTQKEGGNILELDKRLQTAIENFRQTLPAGLSLAAPFVQAPNVASRLNEFFSNLLQGILLVGFVILIFLGLRNALVVMTVIPLSILLAIFALDTANFGLQQLSIAGLVIALGLLVDNGIVVVENINRYLRMGHSPREAAIKGTSEIGWAIVSSTATTLLAFLPMTQLGGGTGEFIQSLPIIVIFSLVASLLLALSFTPLMASWLARSQPEARLSRAERVLQGFIRKSFRPSLNYALRHPVLILAIAIASLGGSFALFPWVGVSFFPTADKPMFLIDLELPDGSKLDATNEVARYVEASLAEEELVRSYTTNVGRGNPQVYYNIIPQNSDKRYAQVLVELENWEAATFYPLLDRLRDRFEAFPGARISVTELKNGPPYEAPIEIKVIGDEPERLRALARQVEQIIRENEGTRNVNNPLASRKAQLRVAVNREKAGTYGVNLGTIDLTVRAALTGVSVGTMNTRAGREYEMVVRQPNDGSVRVSDFDRIYVVNQSGRQLPLRQVAQLRLEGGPAKVDHFDLERTATVTADLRANFEASVVTPKLIERLDAMEWPVGYRYHVGGEYETQQESFGSLGQLLIVAVLGILAVLILQFRSFLQPLVVLSAIPLALSGSIVALFLAGHSFSFLAFVGFTSLVGIVVNTSIILVDYANQLRATGHSKGEAIRAAAETRFTPILLTTLTTICGLLPLTLGGGSLWAPLGWTIIGGMVSSTLLTLLVVPILYKWLG